MQRVFCVSLITTGVLAILLYMLGRPLINPQTSPYGIISFEFAGDSKTAQKMVRSWGSEGSRYAAWNLVLDFPFIVSYSVFLAAALIIVLSRLFNNRSHWPFYGRLLVWAMILPAILDCVENIALFQILFGASGEYLPTIAFWCASVKTAFLTVAIVTIILLWTVPQIVRQRP